MLRTVAGCLMALQLVACATFSGRAEIVVDENLADRTLEYVRALCAERDLTVRRSLLRELNEVAEPHALVVYCAEAPPGG